MRVRSILLIVAFLLLGGGLPLLRGDSAGGTESSFYRSEIWLPHRTGGSYDLIGDEAQVQVPDVPNWPWEGPIYPADKVTLSEARTRVPFAIPLPTSLRDARSVEIEEVWVSAVQAPLDLDEEIYTELYSVAVVFSDGCQMIIHQMDSPPDWDAIIAQQTPVFSKVTINGHPGMGTSPGVQEIMGGQHRYPGSVSWWVDGLEITIYSETLPLEELLEIAHSVRY